MTRAKTASVATGADRVADKPPHAGVFDGVYQRQVGGS